MKLEEKFLKLKDKLKKLNTDYYNSNPIINDSDYDGDTSTASDYYTESEFEDNLIEFKEYILLQALSFKTALCLEFMEKLKSLNGEKIEEIKK